MPYCPKCGAEYREGFTRCEDCDVELTSEPAVHKPTEREIERQSAGRPNHQPELSDEVVLTTVDDMVKFAYITSILEQENIPYRVMEAGAGQYLSVYFGTNYSYMGRNIYVDRKNYEAALEILESYDFGFADYEE